MSGKQLHNGNARDNREGFPKSNLILHTGFLFWPVKSLEERSGWLCGLYASLPPSSHGELLAKGRLARKPHRRALRGEKVSDIKITDDEAQISFLWHENLGASLEAQRVLYETRELDQQRYLEPTALVYGDRAQAALMEFTNLQTGNTQQAIEFIEKFGEFDLLELSEDDPKFSSLPRDVRRFCNECLHPENRREHHDPFAVPLDQFWDTHKEIVGFWKLADFLAARNMDEVREECRRRRPTSHFTGAPDWLAVGKAILCADLSASLNLSSPRPPRLLLHERDGQFIALTLCPTVRSSLYVQLLTVVVSGKEHRQCLLCGDYFTARVEAQEYCTSKCQNIAKERRSRAKKSKQEKRRRNNLLV